MTDFYKIRRKIFIEFDILIRKLTTQKKGIDEAQAVLQADIKHGMGGVLKKHINKLVEQGSVKRETVDGHNVLTWIGPEINQFEVERLAQ